MLDNKQVLEISNNDEVYSNLLSKIKNPPKKLFAIGNVSLLNKNSIAIVGSRNSSEYGRKITEKITKELVKNGIVIVSGMAKGIDKVAHETAIKYGGKTIAVLGSGFNYIYPKENEKLFYNIIENNGLIISEYNINEPIQLKNFPKRNRIISGLSLGTLVIEATYRSGTSITAKYAKLQSRKLFCIPNCIGNKNSRGIINLLKTGGILVTSGEDIFKELKIEMKQNEKNNGIKQLKILDSLNKKVFECILENEGINSEIIAIKTNIDISIVNQILTELEIDEVIETTGLNHYKVKDEYCE